MDAAIRRRLVNLSVAATSAAALGLSWAGVVAADREAEQAQPVILAPADAPTAVAGAPAQDTQLVPAPQPKRQVIIVRQSRAS